VNITIVDFVTDVRPPMLGLVTLRLPSGLVLHKVAVLKSPQSGWAIAAPGRPVLDATGTQRRREDGGKLFEPIVSFHTRRERQAFTDDIVRALRMTNPEVFRA
jgi:hypothetical protein